jgi:hypothetical protein
MHSLLADDQPFPFGGEVLPIENLTMDVVLSAVHVSRRDTDAAERAPKSLLFAADRVKPKVSVVRISANPVQDLIHREWEILNVLKRFHEGQV